MISLEVLLGILPRGRGSQVNRTHGERGYNKIIHVILIQGNVKKMKEGWEKIKKSEKSSTSEEEKVKSLMISFYYNNLVLPLFTAKCYIL